MNYLPFARHLVHSRFCGGPHCSSCFVCCVVFVCLVIFFVSMLCTVSNSAYRLTVCLFLTVLSVFSKVYVFILSIETNYSSSRYIYNINGHVRLYIIWNNNYITSVFHWNVTIWLVMKWSHDYNRGVLHPNKTQTRTYTCLHDDVRCKQSMA